MNWLVFTYSLPSRENSSTRVSLWRRLKRSGAASPKGGVFILPDRDDCLESFQWMAQEIQQSNGEALVMKVERFEGLSEKHVIEFFHSARKKDYDELLPEVKTLHKAVGKAKVQDQGGHDRLKKLRTRFTEITEVDFFRSPHAAKIKELLDEIEAALHPGAEEAASIRALNISDYRGRVWVTRPRPYVDRLACAWLIRRFVDAEAQIRYSDTPKKDELSFDMKDAVFGHRGNFCSFEGYACDILNHEHVGRISTQTKTYKTKQYQYVIWLPFLDTYRTMCLAPEPQFQRVLEEIRAWSCVGPDRGALAYN